MKRQNKLMRKSRSLLLVAGVDFLLVDDVAAMMKAATDFGIEPVRNEIEK